MFSATDISTFLACPHTAALKQAEAKGDLKNPFFKDPSLTSSVDSAKSTNNGISISSKRMAFRSFK